MSFDYPTYSVDHGPQGMVLHTHKIQVDVVAGPDTGRRIELDGPSARIGCAADCDVALSDRTVSRYHLDLHVAQGAIRVRDAGSRNGTRIDGVEIRDAFARPDSLLVIGSTTLRLRMLPELIELPLSSSATFGRLLGCSVPMRRLFSLLERIAPSETTVLIQGETGTGKEVVAESLHERSPRAKGPFVVFDGSAVAPTLAESTLFGHVRGTFTGAVEDRPGLFEEADGGTLFIDEVGELPLELQPKLLRVLERREVRRLGSNRSRRVDVRIVAASNRLLALEVDRGRFREDLYYRLAVVTVLVPPLRERMGDVPLLVHHFEEQWAKANGRQRLSLPEDVLQQLEQQAWPGNVRELRNTVERLLTLGLSAPQRPAPSVDPQPGPPEAAAPRLDEPMLVGRQRVIEAYEREYLRQALARTGGNVSRAAILAGITRKSLYHAIHKYGLGKEAGGREEG